MKTQLDEDKEKLYRMRVYPIKTDTNAVEWVAEFPDLPGCVGGGDTAEEAVLMAMDAKKAWIEVALEDKKNIPEAKNIYENDYSGKFTLRLPRTLHKELTLQAEDEGVSLNQYILYLITKGSNNENIRMTYQYNIDTIKISLDKNIQNIETWRKYYSLEDPLKLLNENFSQKNGRF